MTEKRKQELRVLLEEAVENLEIRYIHLHGGEPIPVDVYRRYLQERWTYYGVDLLSFSRFPFSASFTLDIEDIAIKGKLLAFTKGELALFLDEDVIRDTILAASYVIASDPTNGLCLYLQRLTRLYLSRIIERLLEITLIRGAETAVSVFDKCCYPEGAHGFYQNVALIEGIKLEREIQVFKGVRLVPLPSSEISEELTRYLPNLPSNAFSGGFIDSTGSFFGKTLLVIDFLGFSILHKPAPDPAFPRGLPVDKLPFQVEVQELKFPNFNAVSSFKELFCQALFLACNSLVQIVNGGLFLAEDKSFTPHHKTITMRGDFNLLGSSAEVGEAKIEEAKCLYHILVELHSTVRENKLSSSEKEKLRIAIDRWIQSKTPRNPIDKIIDLGIAFEALYLSDVKDELTFRLGVRAAWYLGKDEEHRKELLTKFGDIYRCRSNAVHNGRLDETVRFGGEHIPVSEFIERAQNLCRKSIKKILKDGEFPDWNSLILGGEDEQASS